jgi:hypothetical protein
VSLILEALKKLEREKEAPDRGFLVLGHLPWATAPKRRLPAAAAVSLVAAVLAAAALALWRAGAERRQPLPAAAAIPASAPRPIAASARPKAAPVPAAPATRSTSTPQPRRVLPAREPGTAAPAPAPSTSSPPPAEAVPAEFRLSAISQQDGVPVAILNDRLVHEGDAFDGVRILRIGEAEVDVEVRGVRRVIRF